MKKYENISLVGLYLIISAVFMPWHMFSEYYPVPGAIGEVQDKISGFALGYHSIMGYIILIASVLTCVLVFIPKENEAGKRVLAAQCFMIAFICMIFVIGGIAPVFIFDSVIPHIGVGITTLGCLISFVGIRKGIKNFENPNAQIADTDADNEEEREERVRERDKI